MTYPNWFDVTARKNFEKHLLPLAGKPGLRFLQLGAFTGDASVWMLENVLTGPGSTLIDVDTWEGSSESAHDRFDWGDVWQTYFVRTGEWSDERLDSFMCTSDAYFRDEWAGEAFDFVYVDADHTPYGALRDAVNAYEVLKVGGLIAFDDYNWADPVTHEGPADAVNAVEACYKRRLQLLQLGPQAWFRKVA